MKGANKFLAGILLGAAAGAALALFLKSDKGKELLTKVKEGAEDLENNLKSNMDNFKQEVNAAIQKGKNVIRDMENNTNEASS